jgi:hypothetical protein
MENVLKNNTHNYSIFEKLLPQLLYFGGKKSPTYGGA